MESGVVSEATLNKCCQNSYVKNYTLHTTPSKLKCAFTLAEVLITLGVIGVVAAMTIPVLIQNHRKAIVETRLKSFYSNFNQALKLSETENGQMSEWEYPAGYTQNDADTFYYKYLHPYIKTLKVDNFGNSAIRKALYMPDGSVVIFSTNTSILFYPNAKDYKTQMQQNNNLYIDESKGGKEFFTFEFDKKKGIVAFGINCSDETIKNHSSQGCNLNATGEKAFCSALIMKNGWKIPDDYPIRF